MRKWSRILVSTGLAGSLATGGLLMFLQPLISAPQTKVDLDFTKSEINGDFDSPDNSQPIFNAMEDAGIVDAASAEEAIINFDLQNGMIRFINGEGNRIKLVEVITQIYGYGYVSGDDNSSDSVNTIGTQTLADFPQFQNVLTGVYFIDWVSQGTRSGLTQTFIDQRTSELEAELIKISTVIDDTHPLSNVVSLLLNDAKTALRTANANQIIKALLQDTAVNQGFNPDKTEWGAQGYNFYPLSADQKGIFQTLAKYNVKAMLNSVTIDSSLKKGAVETANPYYQDPKKGELERMGVDWILVHFGKWRDINYGAKSQNLGPNSINNNFGESSRVADQKPWENFDPDSKVFGLVPQGYLNDDRIETEMVPFFSKLHYAVLEQGTRLAPYDVDNEPNIDISFGHNYGLTPKQYATLGKGVQKTLKTMTTGKSFDLSNASANNNAATGEAMTNPENVTYNDGVDLTISLDSHSRLNADDTFGLWSGENNPNNENNYIKWGLKAYVQEVQKYWPEVTSNAIFTYHTYWDFKPETISDVYQFATSGKSEMHNTNFSTRAGIVPVTSASDIAEHLTVITELSYNFWPDAKLDGDGMGGWGNDNNSWFMAMGYAYQVHYHSQLAGASAFMPYHGADRILSDWKSQADDSQYLNEERVYAHDLNGDLITYPNNPENVAEGKTGLQPAYYSGVTPSLHTYNMLEEGDRYLKNVAKEIETADESIFGDVWYQKIDENSGVLKLFFVNDSENNKEINLNLTNFNAVQLATGTTDSGFLDEGPMEHLTIRSGISNREYIGQTVESGLDGIMYLHLDGKSGSESRLNITDQDVKISLPAWSMYSVELEVS